MPRGPRWILGLTLLGALPGCYDGYDPLDPILLAEIARSRGDAEGFGRSGVYRGTFTTVECGCDEYTAARELSLCFLVETAEQLGIQSTFPVQLIQADGTVRMLPNVVDGGVSTGSLVPTFYGPLSEEGQLRAAGILETDELVFTGQVLGRIEGTFDGTDTEGALQGEYQQRYVLEFLGGSIDFADIDMESVTESIDCRETIEFDLTYDEPLPPIEDEDE